MKHIFFTRDGRRAGGMDHPDRLCSVTASPLLAMLRFRSRQGPEQPFWLHIVLLRCKDAVAWDARWLDVHAASEGYNVADVAAACLGSKYREAGQYAVYWGTQLQELVLDRTKLALNGGSVAVTSLVEMPPACQRLLAVADSIYTWSPFVYALVETALDAIAKKLLLAACAIK